jgi:hypothetical protein
MISWLQTQRNRRLPRDSTAAHVTAPRCILLAAAAAAVEVINAQGITTDVQLYCVAPSADAAAGSVGQLHLLLQAFKHRPALQH